MKLKPESYPVTISEKSAIPEKPLSTPSIRPRCAPRTPASGSSTITLSKNPSTTGRNVAIFASASPYERSCRSLATSGASVFAASCNFAASGASVAPCGEPTANHFSAACRKILLIRLNAADTAWKSAEVRAAVRASARAMASRTSSASAANTAFTTSYAKPRTSFK